MTSSLLLSCVSCCRLLYFVNVFLLSLIFIPSITKKKKRTKKKRRMSLFLLSFVFASSLLYLVNVSFNIPCILCIPSITKKKTETNVRLVYLLSSCLFYVSCVSFVSSITFVKRLKQMYVFFIFCQCLFITHLYLFIL